MTFEEILDQALAMVQRRGRVTYRTLKLQFALDDEQLATLKDELLYSQPQVIDDAERGLVWTGDTGAPPACAPWPPSSASSVLPPTQAVQGARRGADHAAPEAERRQLTVLFCDLVDSTKLSSQLDPEDYRDVVHAYQRVCTDVIQRYDGHIAQLLGDGLLVYLGYPHAHDDDAHRAVRTGLGIVAAMGDLNQALQHTKGIPLAVRLGIHTGLVVVGAMGGAGRQEQLALGETPNIAARIQGLAQPNTVAISAATYRLVQGYFECQALGAQALRGVAEPIAVYRVLSESGVYSRLDVAQPRGLTPLVGRESEVTLLLERWAQVKDGHGQVVLLSGDAGIGKSRLVQVLKDHVANEPHMRWECRSLEYYQNTALFPLTDLFQRLLRFQTEETPDEKFGKLEHALSQYRPPLEESVQLFAPLLSVPVPENHYPQLNLSPQRQRQKTLEALVAILLELAEHQPVLFILEDLHWTDPSTLELLNVVIEQIPTTSILTVLTCRPTFQPSWNHRSYVTEVSVTRLAQPQVARMVERVAGGKTFPDEVLQQIVQRTDGVPLFIEEMTKTVLESGVLKETHEHYELAGLLTTLAIPSTLHDSLMARLDRLMTAKVIAQLGAVMGRQFPYAWLQAVSQLDAATLQRELGRLVEAELVYQRGLPPQATYTFKHALIQDAAYQSLLKSTRQQYHQRIAQVLETRFPAVVETQPELIAHHYTAAACHAQAVPYWQGAGERAIARSAYQEAISHLRQALEGLQTQAHTPERSQRELTVLTTLGPVLVATQSYTAPDVEQTYTRAYALCQQMGETAHLFPVLAGLRRIYSLRNEYQKGREMAERLLALAHRVHNAVFLVEAHFALGNNAYWPGEVVDAHAHFEQGIGLYQTLPHRPSTPQSAQDPGVACLSYAALTAWLLGYPDQALRRSQEALILAHELAHPHTLAFALCWAGLVHTHRREVQAAHERAEAVLALADEHGFQNWRGNGAIVRGWVLAARGQREEGIAQMSRGEAERQARGSRGSPNAPHYLALIAEAYGAGGQTTEGLAVLAEAQALVDHMGGHYYAAEVARLKGELVLAHGVEQQAEAIACLQHALTIARRQQAKALELRAAMSLARLWQRQGKRTEARALLAPIYGWFTEGFDIADLQDAKALLEALA